MRRRRQEVIGATAGGSVGSENTGRAGALRRRAAAVAHIGSVFGASMGGYVVSAACGIYVARSLPVPAYGQFAYLSNLLFVAMLAFGFGLTTSVATRVAEAGAARAAFSARSVFATLVVLRLLSLLPLLAIAAGAAVGQRDSVYLSVAAAAAFAVVGDFLVGTLQGLERTRAVRLCAPAQPVAFAVLLAGGNAADLRWVVDALTLSYLVSVLVPAVFLRALVWDAVRRPELSRAVAGHSVVLSTNVYVAGLFQMGYVSLPIVALGAVGRYTESAHLSIALTLSRVASIGLTLVLTTLFYPRLCRLRADGQHTAALRLASTSYRALAVVSLAGAATLAAWADEIVLTLYGGAYGAAANLTRLLAPLVFFLATESFLSLTQLGFGLGRFVVLATGVRLVALMLVFAGALRESEVAAATSATAYAVSALGGFLLQSRKNVSSLGWRTPVAGTAVAAGAAAAAAFFVRALWQSASAGGGSWLVAAPAGGVLSAVAAALVLERSILGAARRRGLPAGGSP